MKIMKIWLKLRLLIAETRAARIVRYIQKEAQPALLEYLHSTRGLQFIDAENITKNCPHFLEKL